MLFTFWPVHYFSYNFSWFCPRKVNISLFKNSLVFYRNVANLCTLKSAYVLLLYYGRSQMLIELLWDICSFWVLTEKVNYNARLDCNKSLLLYFRLDLTLELWEGERRLYSLSNFEIRHVATFGRLCISDE